MTKTFSKRDDRNAAPAKPARLDTRSIVIDRARHEIAGETRLVEALKIATVDLNRHCEVAVSYALRMEGFLSETFPKKHEVVKALKDGDLDAFGKGLVEPPKSAAVPVVVPSLGTQFLAELNDSASTTETTRFDVTPMADAA